MARKNTAAGVAHKGVGKRVPTSNAKSILEERGQNGAYKQRVNRSPRVDTSDSALADVLKRLKATADPGETRRLTDQLERIIFHKQYKNA